MSLCRLGRRPRIGTFTVGRGKGQEGLMDVSSLLHLCAKSIPLQSMYVPRACSTPVPAQMTVACSDTGRCSRSVKLQLTVWATLQSPVSLLILPLHHRIYCTSRLLKSSIVLIRTGDFALPSFLAHRLEKLAYHLLNLFSPALPSCTTHKVLSILYPPLPCSCLTTNDAPLSCGQ